MCSKSVTILEAIVLEGGDRSAVLVSNRVIWTSWGVQKLVVVEEKVEGLGIESYLGIGPANI